MFGSEGKGDWQPRSNISYKEVTVMKDNSMAKLGGTCAILVGISYLVIAVAFFLLPAGQEPPVVGSEGEYFTSVAESSTAQQVEFWAFGLSSLLAIAAVMAVSDLVRSANEGLVRWTSALAIIGFAVMAAQYLLLQDHTPRLAAQYVQLDESAQAALRAMGPRVLAADGWLDFGVVGLWFLVVNWLALRGGELPKGLAYVGLAGGIAYWLVVAGNVLDIPLLITITAGLGGAILAPIWNIWTGLRLRQADS